MLRIRFDLADLARLRLASNGVATAIEALFSSLTLRQPSSVPLFGGWSADLKRRLPRAAGPLFEVFEPYGSVPMFLVRRTNGVAAFTEHLLSVPQARWRAEFREMGYQPRTGFAHRFMSGEPAVRREFAVGVAAYRAAFDRDIDRMRRLVQADLGYRADVLARHGLGGLLSTLHPAVRWDPPELCLDGHPDAELRVAGREVVLIPSVFLWRAPQVLAEPEQVFVTYPVRGTLSLSRPQSTDPLGDLMGNTRASVLRALARARTTGELAASCGISPASASEHAAVLRRAALVATHREGRSVRHHLTALGRRTLYADPPGPDRPPTGGGDPPVGSPATGTERSRGT